MYHENTNIVRTGWKYKYTGTQLLASAEKLLAEATEKEAKLRKQASGMLANLGISIKHTDQFKHELEQVASEKERLQVYVHEFKRNPEEVYSLSLGDVVYFNFPGAV